ncbi:hypothetical protein [Nonomuraea sp. B10E15]|uniref:hypothetical protein n=1 Tax=Nonomuraea sp. B10E15 TaxID=3153560 RepID=UPI00325F9D9D
MRMNSRPSGPIVPPAPVSAPALGVWDFLVGSDSDDGVTVTVWVLVLVGLGLEGVGVGDFVGVVVGLLVGVPVAVPTTRFTEGPPLFGVHA